MNNRTIRIFCSRDSILIHHLSNHLTNADIPNQIIGDMATGVLGIENPTQEICILVSNNNYIQARRIIEEFVTNE